MEYFQDLVSILYPSPSYSIKNNFLIIHSETTSSIVDKVIVQLESSFIMFSSNIEVHELLLSCKTSIRYDVITRQSTQIPCAADVMYGITIRGLLKPLFAQTILQKRVTFNFVNRSLRKRSFPDVDLSHCSIIGTFNNEFILIESALMIYGIDQHGLHERILYERIKDKSKACRKAIKFGDVLDPKFVVYLINEMKKCKHPFICAHGRPIICKIY